MSVANVRNEAALVQLATGQSSFDDLRHKTSLDAGSFYMSEFFFRNKRKKKFYQLLTNSMKNR